MEETNYYKAKEGYTYKRKIDGFIMGNELYLGLFIDGTQDVIENYEEVIDETQSEVKDRYEDITNIEDFEYDNKH